MVFQKIISVKSRIKISFKIKKDKADNNSEPKKRIVTISNGRQIVKIYQTLIKRKYNAGNLTSKNGSVMSNAKITLNRETVFEGLPVFYFNKLKMKDVKGGKECSIDCMRDYKNKLNVKEIRFLNEGGVARVYTCLVQGLENGHEKELAAKSGGLFNLQVEGQRNAFIKILREATKMRDFNKFENAHTMQLDFLGIGHIEDEIFAFLFMKEMYGDLDHLKYFVEEVMDDQKIQKMLGYLVLKQAIQGLVMISSLNKIHFDIKTSNIFWEFLNSSSECKYEIKKFISLILMEEEPEIDEKLRKKLRDIMTLDFLKKNLYLRYADFGSMRDIGSIRSLGNVGITPQFAPTTLMKIKNNGDNLNQNEIRKEWDVWLLAIALARFFYPESAYKPFPLDEMTREQIDEFRDRMNEVREGAKHCDKDIFIENLKLGSLSSNFVVKAISEMLCKDSDSTPDISILLMKYFYEHSEQDFIESLKTNVEGDRLIAAEPYFFEREDESKIFQNHFSDDIAKKRNLPNMKFGTYGSLSDSIKSGEDTDYINKHLEKLGINIDTDTDSDDEIDE